VVSPPPASPAGIPSSVSSVAQTTPSTSTYGAQTVTVDLTAKKMAFDKSTITVPAGAAVVLNFSNLEAAGSSQVTGIPHNFALYDSPALKKKDLQRGYHYRW